MADQAQSQNPDILNTPLFDNLRKLVNVIDELRDVGLQEYISLPRIAVVGSQSSGKSSLLENIVGLDFLPRGEGLVTRRPLEMRLVHVPDNQRTYGVFAEAKNEKFFDFSKVTDKINELTDKVAGTNKGIVKSPIVLTIYSSICPDLTIIDLPGITRIPLAGSDHPNNIEEITKDIVRHYIKDERTIILCVIPANADISTSDGLQLARQYDKEGNRTIGVITKIDIMDRGTDARKMLLGKEVELKLGYIGVKNRSQADINDKMKVNSALKIEQEFFSKHPVYSTMPPNLLGTKALISKLSTVMFEQIRKFLPAIIKEINQKIKECEERLRDLGPALPSNSKEKLQLLWNVITDFSDNFKNQLCGRYDGKRTSKVSDSELSGGAIIKMMFNELYSDYLDRKGFRASDRYTDQQIEDAIKLHQGDSIPGFPSIDAFLYLIQPLLQELKEPAVECLFNVFNYLDNLSQKLVEKLFGRFPQIIEEIQETASKVLQEEREKTKQMVENLIDAEIGYLFTNDYFYLTERTSIIPQQEPQQKPQNPQQQQQLQQQRQENFDPNQLFIKELKNRINSYFNLVLRNIRDTIPKNIGYFLVRSSQDKMQFALYSDVMKNEAILELLGEPQHIAQERETINKILATLKKAQKVLKKDPDLAASYDKMSGNEEEGKQGLSPNSSQAQLDSEATIKKYPPQGGLMGPGPNMKNVNPQMNQQQKIQPQQQQSNQGINNNSLFGN